LKYDIISSCNFQETKKRISENHHNVNGENNPMYGKKHSPETIEKIRQRALERSLKKQNNVL
jgi:hypothetical protein